MASFASAAIAAVTPELQRTIRENTFEVVTKKPADPLTYEKPLPLELLPFTERNDAYRSIGTAFALGNNTYVTAAHVFQLAIGSQFGPPQLRRADGTVYSLDRVLEYSLHEDFVVFSLKDGPAPAGLSPNRDPKIDETVLAVGNALGEGIVIRDGLYTSDTPENQDGRWKWIRFSAAASPGNSGGPLCDEQGRVVGVVIGKSPNENLNYSLPIGRVLDAEKSTARFEQKTLMTLPFLHGTTIYQYDEKLALPLTWQPFSDAALKLNARHSALGRDKLLKTYADTLFPKGPQTEDVLFDPAISETSPRFIMQEADGAWTGSTPQFHSVQLAGDGSIAVATGPEASLIRLVRPGTADDDAFYKDTKGFMDLLAKALDMRRPVGTDQVKVVSLGAAKSDEIVTDDYGRKWQQRVWAVPFLDLYIVGELLPTPDGYAGFIVPTPSFALAPVTDYARLLANQFDVSYTGTLSQWRAALKRRELIPSSLAGMKLDSAPTWTLQTGRVISAVPKDVLELGDKSFLTLTMNFTKVGAQTTWDVQEIRWDRDNTHTQGVSVWRRMRPPASARLALRNQYDSIHEQRMPYDGSLNRETEEVFAASETVNVPGPRPGTVAGDLQYGLTIRLVGHPSNADADRSLANLKSATKVLEQGAEAGAPAPPHAAAASLVTPMATANWKWPDFTMGVHDLRGRMTADDLKQYLGDQPSSDPGTAEKLRLLEAYWREVPSLMRNRELWTTFLSRNHLPDDSGHRGDVLSAEQTLLGDLQGDPSPAWAADAAALRRAYIAERTDLVKRGPTRNPAIKGQIPLQARSTPCPDISPPDPKPTGSAPPRISRSPVSAEEFWPAISKRMGEEGMVMAEIKISNQGCVVEAGIAFSSGSPSLDDATLQFVQTLEFTPAYSNGVAIDKEVMLPVAFKLSK